MRRRSLPTPGNIGNKVTSVSEADTYSSECYRVTVVTTVPSVCRSRPRFKIVARTRQRHSPPSGACDNAISRDGERLMVTVDLAFALIVLSGAISIGVAIALAVD